MKNRKQRDARGRRLANTIGRDRKLSSRAALDALLNETIAFLLAAGLSKHTLASELRKEARRLGYNHGVHRSKATQVVKREHESLGEIAGVVHDWHRQTAYTKRTSGEPRALRPGELRSLMAKRLPRERITAALRWMLLNRIISRKKNGTFGISTGRQVVLTGRKLAMERAAALVPQYLRISLRNADTANPQVREIDRDARVFFLPEKWIGLWKAVARERAEAFLEGIDNWLEDHIRGNEGGPVREVALHCYTFTGEPRTLQRRDCHRRGGNNH